MFIQFKYLLTNFSQRNIFNFLQKITYKKTKRTVVKQNYNVLLKKKLTSCCIFCHKLIMPFATMLPVKRAYCNTNIKRKIKIVKKNIKNLSKKMLTLKVYTEKSLNSFF